MAQPSTRIIDGLRRLHFNRLSCRPTPGDGSFASLFASNPNSHVPFLQNPLRSYSSALSSSGFSNSRRLIPEIHLKSCSGEFLSNLTSQNGPIPHVVYGNPSSNTPLIRISVRSYSYGGLQLASSNSSCLSPGINPMLQTLPSRSSGSCELNGNSIRYRYFSSTSSDFAKINGNFTKKVFDKPLSAVRSAFSRYREAVGLQIEGFWKRNYLVLLGALGVGLCIVLWRVMFGIANTFIGLSEGMAKYGFLALSTAIVALTGLYVRSRFTINPDRVYRIAMRKLNTSAGILEVMGAPLSGTDLRAYVMSGGGLRMKNFKPRLRGKRCFLIFPMRGSERKGLVSVEVKKKKGQYDMKLLAVDVPMTKGPDQRLFLIGDEEEYMIGGGIISELRDPIVKAMAAEKEFESLDQEEEEEDERRELEEVEKRHHEEMEKLEKASSS